MKIGFVGTLTIVLVVLRAFALIDWSWWWVFSPLIIGTALSILTVVGILALKYFDENRW